VSVRAAFDLARRDLARYPGEAAVIDMIEDGLRRWRPDEAQSADGLSSAAYIVSRLYFNRRLGACALMPSGPFQQ
jgi:hypothetical protein